MIIFNSLKPYLLRCTHTRRVSMPIYEAGWTRLRWHWTNLDLKKWKVEAAQVPRASERPDSQHARTEMWIKRGNLQPASSAVGRLGLHRHRWIIYSHTFTSQVHVGKQCGKRLIAPCKLRRRATAKMFSRIGQECFLSAAGGGADKKRLHNTLALKRLWIYLSACLTTHTLRDKLNKQQEDCDRGLHLKIII